MLLLLADDHSLVREGLKHTLSGLLPDLSFLEAATATEVMTVLEGNHRVELVLLDLVMPGCNGFDLLTKVCETYPDLPVVILSASAEPAQMRKSLDLGAAGFIPKHASAEVMLSALRLVMAGGIYVPPDLLRMRDSPPPGVHRPGPSNPHAEGESPLTARQRMVLACLGQGKSNKIIARELGLSENTVKIHVAAILRGLGVANRTQAALAAREQGLISDSKTADTDE